MSTPPPPPPPGGPPPGQWPPQPQQPQQPGQWPQQPGQPGQWPQQPQQPGQPGQWPQQPQQQGWQQGQPGLPQATSQMPPGPQQAYGPQPAFYAPQYGARFGRRGFGPVQRNIPATILIVIGAIAIGGSVFLEWGTTALFDHSRNADQIPLEFLWNNTPGALDTFPLRWPMWLGAILMFGSAFNARAKAGAFVGGILAIATAALFVNAVRRVHADAALAIGGSSLSGIGIGPWLCLGGGLVGIVGAIISMRSSPRS